MYSEFESVFVSKSEDMDLNMGIDGSECVVCKDTPTDAIFIIDDSASIMQSLVTSQRTYAEKQNFGQNSLQQNQNPILLKGPLRKDKSSLADLGGILRGPRKNPLRLE